MPNPLAVRIRIFEYQFEREHPEFGWMRLGRHIHHDPRSKDYAYPVADVPGLRDTEHARHCGILNQLKTGSCTGNALTGALGTDPIYPDLPLNHPNLDEHEALSLYSDAEDIDGDGPYPPNDNGSSGLSVCKAGVNAGLLSGYQHCFGLDHALQALVKTAWITGINWYDSMDQPDSNGLVTISPKAVVRGGHEVEARLLDTGNRRIGLDNSWGTAWGNNGSFWIGWDDFARLLSEQGDVTVPIPDAQPAPTPQPQPAPPGPSPAPTPVSTADQVLWNIAGPWAAQNRTRADLVILQAALNEWASQKGLR